MRWSPGERESRVKATGAPQAVRPAHDRNRHANVAQEAITLKGASVGPMVIGIVFITQAETRLIGILGLLAAAVLSGWEWHRRKQDRDGIDLRGSQTSAAACPGSSSPDHRTRDAQKSFPGLAVLFERADVSVSSTAAVGPGGMTVRLPTVGDDPDRNLWQWA